MCDVRKCRLRRRRAQRPPWTIDKARVEANSAYCTYVLQCFSDMFLAHLRFLAHLHVIVKKYIEGCERACANSRFAHLLTVFIPLFQVGLKPLQKFCYHILVGFQPIDGSYPQLSS